MKLDIIVPQYKENEQLIGHLLSSINNQIGIDLKSVVTVTIVNDHSDYKLNENFLNSFLFKVNYIETPVNGGAGRARQYGIDNTTADYIMFCDADDRLHNASVLLEICNRIRLLEVQEKPWAFIWTYFYEEYRKDRAFDLISHDKASVIWMHGKVWNRTFLQENNIRFHDTLRTFEDTYFGKVVAMLAPKTYQINLPIYSYLWMRNPNSVTADWNHDNRSYLYWNNRDYITCGESVAEKLYQNIDKVPRWHESLLINFFFTYCILNSKDYRDTENQTTAEKINEMEDFVHKLYTKYGHTLDKVNETYRIKVFKSVKQDCLIRFEYCNEAFSWNDWLKHLDEKYSTDMFEKLSLSC